jgi:hypothetical protein
MTKEDVIKGKFTGSTEYFATNGEINHGITKKVENDVLKSIVDIVTKTVTTTGDKPVTSTPRIAILQWNSSDCQNSYSMDPTYTDKAALIGDFDTIVEAVTAE